MTDQSTGLTAAQGTTMRGHCSVSVQPRLIRSPRRDYAFSGRWIAPARDP